MAIDSRNEVLCLVQKRGESLKKQNKTTHITNNCGRSLDLHYINKCPEGNYKLIIQAHFSYSSVKSWFKDNNLETPVALNLKCQFYGCSTFSTLISSSAFQQITNVHLPWLCSTPKQNRMVVMRGGKFKKSGCYTMYTFTGTLQFTKSSPLPNCIHI